MLFLPFKILGAAVGVIVLIVFLNVTHTGHLVLHDMRQFAHAMRVAWQHAKQQLHQAKHQLHRAVLNIRHHLPPPTTTK